ncbi:histidine kinase [Aquimarina sp. 2201CG5-10]|uniref:tetratricopeptide repeat-containing sensor histidine kinase n=1 Tax=Aquimarina callyspongiae TaxID=3098150 RepID=UPI002AB458AF|nr:histidine kinase [Aquimarina sp. 2201CG5-10]MDY8137125.1 histidine kinase [Aquimarina sp. 2201CG5-10]
MKIFTFFLLICILSVSGIYAQDPIDRELNKSIVLENDSVESLIKKADSLSTAKDLNLAEEAYKKAFRLARRTGEKDLMLDSGLRLERFQSAILEKHDEAKEVIDFLNNFCTKLGDEDCVTLTMIRYGELNQRQSQFIKGLKYFNEALQRVEGKGNKNLHWQVLTARGILLMDIGDLDQSKIDFKKAANYLTEEDSDDNRSITYVNISASFWDNQPDSTIYYSKLALRNCNNDKTSRRCNLAYNNMAWSYFQKGMPEMALDLINKNIDFDNIEYSDRDSLYPSLMHTLGSIYHKLGDYTTAIKYFELAHQFFIKRNDITNIILTKEDLSKSYEKTGNLLKSLELLRDVKPLTAKLDNIRISKEIARIESKKLLEIKEEQISDLEEENLKIGKAINKNRLFSYLLGSFLFIAISILLYRGHTNKVRFHQLNEELSLNRLKSLRSMMNPHFLFNSFSTLQNYILKKDNLKANEYMTELSGLIRNVLSSSDSIYISFKEELQILKSYIRIEQERFSENFKVVYNIDNKLVDSNPTIPSMVVQPYIENAIIHGFSHSDKKGLLTLSFYKESNALICRVLDNGIGRDKAEQLQKQGNDTIHLSIATRNTDERLRILSRIGGDNTSVLINDLFDDLGRAKGTEVIIRLPILKENK